MSTIESQEIQAVRQLQMKIGDNRSGTIFIAEKDDDSAKEQCPMFKSSDKCGVVRHDVTSRNNDVSFNGSTRFYPSKTTATSANLSTSHVPMLHRENQTISKSALDINRINLNKLEDADYLSTAADDQNTKCQIDFEKLSGVRPVSSSTVSSTISSSPVSSSPVSSSPVSSSPAISSPVSGCKVRKECCNREKYLTARYPKQQITSIRRRLEVENWIDDKLKKLFDATDDDDGAAYEAAIDVDELLDLHLPTDRYDFIQRQVWSAPKSPTAITQFIQEVLEKVQSL